MRLLLLLFIILNFLLAIDTSDLKLKTERNRVLILEQHRLQDFSPYITNPWFEDEIFANILLDRGDNIYAYLHKSLQENENIIQKSMKLSVLNYKYLPEKYRKDKQLTLQAVKKYWYLLEYADETLKDDIDLINEVYASNPNINILKYASNRINDDKQFMLKIIKKNPYALEYASKRLKADKDIVTLATLRSRHLFKFADNTLKKDKAYIKIRIQNNNPREGNGNILRDADKSLQSNPEFIKMALDNGLSTLHFSSETIQRKQIFALKALANSSGSISNVHSSLYEDSTYMLAAIKENPHNIKYVQNKLTNDINLALTAIKEDIQIYLYLSPKLQQHSLIKAYLPKKKIIDKQKFSIKIPSLVQRKRTIKGAVRGISIEFLLISDERDLKFQLLSPPKGMKIVEELFDELCSTSPYLGAANSAVIVKWDIPMDTIEGKVYNITMRAINQDGYIEALTFPIKVPKTKLIQTKVLNNELIVTDKGTSFYGMKMKGYKGEDISTLKLRAIYYRDVWKKNITGREPNDVVERLVFVVDNMPNKLDIKMPKWMNTYEKREELKVRIYRYHKTNHSWDNKFWSRRMGEKSINYENTDGYYISSDNKNLDNIFMFLIRKSQNKKL